MARYGTTERALGEVVVAQRRHAANNPLAAFTTPMTIEDYFANEVVAWPLRSLDMTKLTAGGAAVILARADRATDMRKEPIFLRAVGRQQAPMTLDDEHLLCHGMREVARQVYGSSGLRPSDVDVLGVSDATSVAIPQTLENYGFCPEGGSEDFLVSGGMSLGGGGIPTNTDGGQLSGGYLVGWLHQVELTRQLRGEAGPRQVPGARIGQYTTTGRYLNDYLSTIYVTAEALA
jgi:acetyl-CoA acetyltransferase